MTNTTSIPATVDVASHVDRRVAIGSIIAFWAFYFVINTARAAIIGAED